MPSGAPRIYQFDRFTLDAERCQLFDDGQPVAMQPKPLALLIALVEGRGQMLSKDELLERVWPGQFVEESNLTVHMSALRRALGDQRTHPRFILTESGRGYRFIADVRDAPGGAPGRPAEVEHGRAATVDPGVARGAWPAYARPLIAAAALVGFVALIASYRGAFRSPDDPFEQIALSPFTRTGRAAAAAMAPDGRTIAYVLSEPDGHSLWAQHVGSASSIRVVPAVAHEFWGLAFSPDGSVLYYSVFNGAGSDIDLFRVSVLGGLTERIPAISAPGFALSPDGSRIAYTGSHAAEGRTFLRIAGSDGSGSRLVAERRQPENFAIAGQVIAWAPGADALAAVVTHFTEASNFSTVIAVDVRTGAERPLSNDAWHNVSGLQWLSDGSGVLIVASDHPAALTQVWFLPADLGAPRRITNDLSQYSWLGVAQDGRAAVAVQTHATSSLWTRDRAANAPARQILSEVGPLRPVIWLPDGRIAFRSNADGRSNVWVVNADGNGRRQLTSSADVSDRGMCVAADGRHLVFASWRAKKQNLWRLDLTGGEVTQLTDGDGEAHPSCARDGSVIYQRGLGIGRPTAWRITDGRASVLIDRFAAKPVISNDGTRVAFFQLDADRWRIGVADASDGRPLQSFEVPATVTDRVLEWATGDEALYFIATTGDVGNLWTLPLDGAAPAAVTSFTSHLLEAFALSPSGDTIAFTRSSSSRDVVVISDLRRR